jgi:hypothetical protein
VVAEVNGAADALAAARALEAVPTEDVLDEALEGADGDSAGQDARLDDVDGGGMDGGVSHALVDALEDDDDDLADDREDVVVESELEGYSIDE